VQDVPYAKLKELLVNQVQVLEKIGPIWALKDAVSGNLEAFSSEGNGLTAPSDSKLPTKNHRAAFYEEPSPLTAL